MPGCQQCHLDFVRTESAIYNNSWPNGMHDTHSSEMLNNVCEACHLTGDSNNPYLNRSDGTAELPGIGCLGCHGRYYAETGTYTGAGLRARHMNMIPWDAECYQCHTSDPVPLGEDVLPVYYARTDVNIFNTCNWSGTESWSTDGWGLDNDGNLYTDFVDPLCAMYCTDYDMDVFYGQQNCGTLVDCDDLDPNINPVAFENCADGLDNNCDGLADAAAPERGGGPCTDSDNDGFYAEANCGTAVDSNDGDPGINPGATEVCTDGIDNNCDGFADSMDPYGADQCCLDVDMDGFTPQTYSHCYRRYGLLWGDCDNDPVINPAALEDCADGVDNNCDGLADDTTPGGVDQCCVDADVDGFTPQDFAHCEPLYGLVPGDCNDNDPLLNPSAAEVCDGVDNNCDGLTDTEDPICPVCVPTDVREKGKKCSDGIDNDCDGVTDALDPDCGGDEDPLGGSQEICTDGIDNDGDGKTDCDDKKDCGRDRAC